MNHISGSSRRNLAVIALAGASLLFLGACDKKLDSDVKKASYAVGHEIGKSLQSQSVSLDPQIMALALRDITEGREPRMSAEDMEAAKKKLGELSREASVKAAEQNLKDSMAWLENNKSNPQVQVTASGLQYLEEKKGDGPKPKPNDLVKVHYTGTLRDGTKFDSSLDRGEPVEFPLDRVIPGWQEGVQLMNVGGKAKLFVPPELGYRDQSLPNIPANSVLVFDVELLDAKPAPAMPEGMGMMSSKQDSKKSAAKPAPKKKSSETK